MKLLLDEMHAPAVAARLRDRGHDAVAVKERADLIGLTDEDLLRAATADGRSIVTENVKDFAALHRSVLAAGHQHSGLVFTHPRRFPRSAGNHASVPGDSLALFLDEHGSMLGDVESFVWWLERAGLAEQSQTNERGRGSSPSAIEVVRSGHITSRVTGRTRDRWEAEMAYYDLGAFGWPVTTQDSEAQLWFDRGMAWCYGYNHGEAIVCFERALAHDPGLAMAHWGIAYAIGPNYNKPWESFDDEDKRHSLERALAASAAAADAADGASDIERALIGALAKRYPSSPEEEDFGLWNDAYADAMRAVYQAHRTDLDVCALFAEAIMNRTPWELWDLVTGEPAEGASTLEAIEVLETAFTELDAKGANRHPGLLHMYIHLMEMSPHPERALRAGDTLVDLVPDAGHLVHMATHIDVLCGHYQNVVARNSAAAVADRKYLEQEGPMNFYSTYRCHNYHFKVYGAMFLGQYGPAMDAATEMIQTLPAELLRTGSPPMADWLEAFVPIKQHVLIRFGKWQEILDQAFPSDRELYCVTTAMMRYSRAVAYASTGQVEAAEQEREAFVAARDRVPERRTLFNNTCLDILAVAEAMMTGEIEYRRGNFDTAFEHLNRAVEFDDNLPYDEPWGWMQPTRHALGALLMEQGRLGEAEAVYRADLGLDGQLRRACWHPDNVWSLHGLNECLTRRGETVEASHIKQRLDVAVARADVPIEASCFCRLERAA